MLSHSVASSRLEQSVTCTHTQSMVLSTDRVRVKVNVARNYNSIVIYTIIINMYFLQNICILIKYVFDSLSCFRSIDLSGLVAMFLVK